MTLTIAMIAVVLALKINLTKNQALNQKPSYEEF
jgi:hypothetical protein